MRNHYHPGSYVIGDSEFVRGVLAKERENRLRIVRHRLERLSTGDLAAKFATAAGITPEDLLRRFAAVTAAARKVFAYVCCREYGFTIVEVAQYLGHTHSPMSLAVRQGERLRASADFGKVQMALRPYGRPSVPMDVPMDRLSTDDGSSTDLLPPACRTPGTLARVPARSILQIGTCR
jgi:hypothetical protein